MSHPLDRDASENIEVKEGSPDNKFRTERLQVQGGLVHFLQGLVLLSVLQQ